MRPSPTLGARLRFTTKEVGKGFYRGSRTGSLGAHTRYGGYLIDWRKVRHYVVPDLTDFDLTPFVTKEMEPKSRMEIDEDGSRYTPKYVDGMRYLKDWKELNRSEYEEVLIDQTPPELPESEAVNSIESTEQDALEIPQVHRLEDSIEQNELKQGPPTA